MKKHIITFILSVFFVSVFAQIPTFQWAKTVGGTMGDYTYSSCVDATGNIYTVGIFYGLVDFDPGVGVFNLISVGYNDGFILKLDPLGNFVWVKQIGGTSYDELLSITIDATNSIYITGDFADTADFNPGSGIFNMISTGGADIFALKLDSNGDFLWAKQIETTSYGIGNSIAVDNNSNVLVTGYYTGASDFDPGSGIFTLTPVGGTDIFAFKLNASGDFLWAHSFGDSSNDIGVSIDSDTDGNVYLSGQFAGTVDFNSDTASSNLFSVGGADIFILKTNASGNFLWVKQFKGNIVEYLYQMKVNSNGDVYTIGQFDGTVDFNPGVGVVNLTPVGGLDMFIAKIDSSGNYSWVKQLEGANNECGYSLDLDVYGSVYCLSKFGGTCDFDPGAGFFNMTATSGSAAIVKLDIDGAFLWAGQLDGASEIYPYSISVDYYGEIYSCGLFSGTADFDPSTSIYNLNADVGGSYDNFIQKMNQPTFGIAENKQLNGMISLYPNPTSNYLTIETTKPTNISIVNLLGQELFNSKIEKSQTIDVSFLANGIYFVKDLQNGGSVKFLKQ